ncbi:uncharacterized protein LOC120445140 [Drosophila santomea]|uniref:uncharacterized protein LOC120445140 n=1 Tax=Drosophila santomea TaxID=129105 RepID=UPI001952FBFE|nr:uncharacterized protein LOC120445140 [Drosophila santomea]
MAITRRLPWPKLLFLFVWLCLALDLNRAARVPSISKNSTHPSTESKMITFVKEPEPDKPAPWDQTEATTIASTANFKPNANASSVEIGPRIVLETSPKCPEGTTLTANSHCRKIA